MYIVRLGVSPLYNEHTPWQMPLVVSVKRMLGMRIGIVHEE